MSDTDFVKNTGKVTPELLESLIKCQQQLTHAPKKGANPFFNSDYVPYEALRDHVEAIYSEHGIYIHQVSHRCDNGVGIETIFVGHNGAISNGIVEIPAPKNDPHGYGSAQTYAKRYSLALACGIGGEKDDDGNANIESPKKENKNSVSRAQNDSQKKALDFEKKERETKLKKSQSIRKYSVKKGSAEICTLASNQFASYCDQYIKDPAKETDREIFKGTEEELAHCLNDETLRADGKTNIQNILSKFGGQNAN